VIGESAVFFLFYFQHCIFEFFFSFFLSFYFLSFFFLVSNSN
jgi:hypothetical protein